MRHTLGVALDYLHFAITHQQLILLTDIVVFTLSIYGSTQVLKSTHFIAMSNKLIIY